MGRALGQPTEISGYKAKVSLETFFNDLLLPTLYLPIGLRKRRMEL